MTDSYDMDTFGKPIQTTGSTPNPYRFGAAWGYITDPNGFLQLGARYYWPEVGRFVSQDPVQDGINWYIYAENNPLAMIDPEGLCPAGISTPGTACGPPRNANSGRPCPRPKRQKSCKKQYQKDLRKCKRDFRLAKVGAFLAAMGHEMRNTCGTTGSGESVQIPPIENPNTTGNIYYDLVEKAKEHYDDCVARAKEKYNRCQQSDKSGAR